LRFSLHPRDWSIVAGPGPMGYNDRSTLGFGIPDTVLRKISRENALRWLPGLKA